MSKSTSLKDNNSKKNGSHAILYMTNGDTYHGEWKNDLKHGILLLLNNRKWNFYMAKNW
jgi:hypothetical protein